MHCKVPTYIGGEASGVQHGDNGNFNVDRKITAIAWAWIFFETRMFRGDGKTAKTSITHTRTASSIVSTRTEGQSHSTVFAFQLHDLIIGHHRQCKITSQ